MPPRLDVDIPITVNLQLAPALEDNDDTNDGAVIDLQSFPGHRVLLVAAVGTRTDGTFTFSLRESDNADGSSSTEVTPVSGSLTAVSAASTTRKASFAPTKRYVFARSVASATTSGAIQTAVVLLIPAFGAV